MDAPNTEPCPVCGAPRRWYVHTGKRGRATKGGGHRAGEHRSRRELRDTCGKKRCQQVLRARSLLKNAGGDP